MQPACLCQPLRGQHQPAFSDQIHIPVMSCPAEVSNVAAMEILEPPEGFQVTCCRSGGS